MEKLLRHLPANPIARGIALHNLAVRKVRLGRPCQAYALVCRGTALLEEHLPPDHPQRQVSEDTLRRLTRLLAPATPRPGSARLRAAAQTTRELRAG